jgi:polyphosphate kinase
MVRGVCLLRPGAPGISDNIRIVSLAGRLLQHARIFHFRNGGSDEYFIGSADWRPRNFDSRIEVVTGVSGDEHKATLDRSLTETLTARDAWTLGADGVYRRDTASRPSPADQGNRTYVTLTPS